MKMAAHGAAPPIFSGKGVHPTVMGLELELGVAPLELPVRGRERRVQPRATQRPNRGRGRGLSAATSMDPGVRRRGGQARVMRVTIEH